MSKFQPKKQFFCELLGTFLLAVFVLMSTVVSSFPFPEVVASLVVGLMVYVVGPISGAHFNPAISLGLWLNNRLSMGMLVRYLLAQLFGAKLAFWFVERYVSDISVLSVSVDFSVFLFEAFGTVLLGLAVASIVLLGVSKHASGLVVAMGLFLGITIAGYGSFGILNPSLAWVMGAFSWPYILGPVFGAFVAFQIC